MRLILHIGTHKTGTSSLQQVLKVNENLLKENGIYYVRRPRSKNSNYLAKLLAFGKIDQAKGFIEQNIRKANSAGAHTLVVSAESFYAMTKLFQELEGRPTQDYWHSESELIKQFVAILPPKIHLTVFVCFRRQDRFLESIYSQLIKSRMVAPSIDEFGNFMGEALDYWRHIEIWRKEIPDCIVCSYESFSRQINNYFLQNILKLPSTKEYVALELRTNKRISRDVLEYKRILNRRKYSTVERRLNSKICTDLSEVFPDHGNNMDYLSRESRKKLIEEMKINNDLLIKNYGMTPFPEYSEHHRENVSNYNGLSPEKAIRIADHHHRIKGSFRYQKEKLGLTIAQFIRQKLPLFTWIIPIGRLVIGERVVSAVLKRQ